MRTHDSSTPGAHPRPVILLLALVVPALLLAGCGGTETPPGDRVMQTYFDGIATQTVASLRGAVAAAEPGSPAAAYATYLQASSQAATDSGHPVEQDPQSADRTPKGFRFCQGGGSDKTCYEYADITRADGKVSDFTVNGKPITERLAVGSARPVAFKGLDAHATFVAAYETTASDNLLVAVRITAGAGTAGLGAVKGSYRAPPGARVPSAQAFGPARLKAGSSANYLFAFPKASLGGRLTLSSSDSGSGSPGAVTLRIR